jgi:hypothetical protein
MLAPLLVALLLAGPADVEAPPQPDPSGWRHDLGLGAHSTTFSSKEGVQYTFHSLSLGYLGSVGALGGFLHMFLLLPLQARQDGDAFATSSYYGYRTGGDLLLGAQHRWSLGTTEVEAGPGFHAMAIYLPGKTGYRDFSALPMGVGASGIVRWRTGAERLSRAVTVGAYASVAYDFADPAHAKDLTHGFTFRLGVAVGLGGRR